jgi:hypothetical protein
MNRLQELPQKSTGRPGAPLDAASLREIICEATRSECVKSFGGLLRAIVLTGSVARDEASFVRKEDWWQLYGDAEFMLVLERTATMPSATTLSSLVRQIEDDLTQHHIHCRVDLSAVRPSYFRRLPPHIFTYELKHCGRVIWGDAQILESIPDVSASDLSREDAWRLLCNRLIEQLAFVGDLSNASGELTPGLHYATIKLYLDMATSYLVFAGEYEPTYRGRAEKLRRVAERARSDGAVPFSLEDLSAHVSKCTEWKLSGSDMLSDLRPELWAEAIRFARSLWQWEAVQLTRASGDISTRVLFDRLSAQLSFTQKVRGWASVAKCSGGLKSWRCWPRWTRLGFQTTPRYSVYRVGIELAFRLPLLLGDAQSEPISDGELLKLQSLLPARETDPWAAEWQAMANAVLSNYYKFLIGTVA